MKTTYPVIADILNEMCEEEKERMRHLPGEELGSWNRAVVTSDGVWQTRGQFSTNGSLIIKNDLSGGLLWLLKVPLISLNIVLMYQGRQ